jgi:hypothetical protein
MVKIRRKVDDHVTLGDLIREAEEWDSKYLDVIVHSVKLYAEDDYQGLIKEFLSHTNRGAFKLTNPHSKKLWLPELIQSFLRTRRVEHGHSWKKALQERRVACAVVTLTHKDWACSDTNIQFDLKRAKQKVRNALVGTDFLASFEAAPYKNEEWKTDGKVGKLICFHCHAVAWSGSRSGLDRLRSRIKGRFEPILGNKSGARFDALKTENDLTKTIRYMTKMPFLGYRTVTNGKGKKTQRSSNITFKSRWHLFNALKQYDLFEFWLAGGEGVNTLREARNRLKKKYKPHAFSARRPRFQRFSRLTPKYRQ